MKHKQMPLIILNRVILVSVFVFNFLLIDTSYSSEDKVTSKVKDGYRILEIDTHQGIQEFTVYRGDYIKFLLPEEIVDSSAVFPTLKKEKPLTHDLKTTSYFKMKQIGIYPFQIQLVKGQIKVIEYQQASYKALSSKEADGYIKTYKPLILDVRTKKEYEKGHIENSILLPVQELQKRIHELDVYKNNAILIYCATGNRSTVASKILIDSGFNKIFNLRYGISDWVRKKYPIVR